MLSVVYGLFHCYYESVSRLGVPLVKLCHIDVIASKTNNLSLVPVVVYFIWKNFVLTTSFEKKIKTNNATNRRVATT